MMTMGYFVRSFLFLMTNILFEGGGGMSSELNIEKVGQVGVRVHDLPRAVAFYRDTLKLPLIWQGPNMAFFACDDVRLYLSVPEHPAFDHPSSVIYFQVGDIHAACSALTSRGVELLGAPHEVGRLGHVSVWMAFFHDSEGNTLAVQSEVPVD
jgi:predicted enzyme related to lactoylglutathione lyase